ncbi:MAG: TetR/AcrR family transcriptional regulator [Pseudomonadales bacterium]
MSTEPAQRDSEATRQRLLEVATQSFAAVGLDGVRVDQLAQAAGVNKRMIYHYFGDKRGLYNAVLESAAIGLQAPADLTDLEGWRKQVAEHLRGDRVRLLAWEGLRLGAERSGDGPEASQSGPNPAAEQNAQDVALLYAALAVLPELCPQLVQAMTGQAARAPEFQQRWQRFARRLGGMIGRASQAPKERVRLTGSARPSVR